MVTSTVPSTRNSDIALQEYLAIREELRELEGRDAEYTCDPDEFHSCEVCERYARKNQRAKRLIEPAVAPKGRIMCRIAKWGKIVFKASANSPASILERLVDIFKHFTSDGSERGSVFSPHPQPITGMSAG